MTVWSRTGKWRVAGSERYLEMPTSRAHEAAIRIAELRLSLLFAVMPPTK